LHSSTHIPLGFCEATGVALFGTNRYRRVYSTEESTLHGDPTPY